VDVELSFTAVVDEPPKVTVTAGAVLPPVMVVVTLALLLDWVVSPWSAAAMTGIVFAPLGVVVVDVRAITVAW
jgi:hypothetical protein